VLVGAAGGALFRPTDGSWAAIAARTRRAFPATVPPHAPPAAVGQLDFDAAAADRPLGYRRLAPVERICATGSGCDPGRRAAGFQSADHHRAAASQCELADHVIDVGRRSPLERIALDMLLSRGYPLGTEPLIEGSSGENDS